MKTTTSLIKGVHPGVILERELKLRQVKKGLFALSIGEYPQVLGDVTKGKRRMNPALSLKVEKALGMEEGYFMVLQAYYDIAQEKRRQAESYHPDLSKIRPIVFWDTDIKTIDWERQKTAVIRRIFERGNKREITEIIRFYGKEAVQYVLKIARNLSPTTKQNKYKYLKWSCTTTRLLHSYTARSVG